MSTGPALSIVTLGVTDLGRSEAFYDALGWQRATSSVPGVITWYGLGGVWLGLFPAEHLAADTGLPGAPRTPAGGFAGVTLAMNLGSVEEVAAAVANARAAGAAVTVEPVTTDYGVHHACFTDPDAFAWEVAWNPGFPIVDGRTIIP